MTNDLEMHQFSIGDRVKLREVAARYFRGNGRGTVRSIRTAVAGQRSLAVYLVGFDSGGAGLVFGNEMEKSAGGLSESAPGIRELL